MKKDERLHPGEIIITIDDDLRLWLCDSFQYGTHSFSKGSFLTFLKCEESHSPIAFFMDDQGILLTRLWELCYDHIGRLK